MASNFDLKESCDGKDNNEEGNQLIIKTENDFKDDPDRKDYDNHVSDKDSIGSDEGEGSDVYNKRPASSAQSQEVKPVRDFELKPCSVILNRLKQTAEAEQPLQTSFILVENPEVKIKERDPEAEIELELQRELESDLFFQLKPTLLFCRNVLVQVIRPNESSVQLFCGVPGCNKKFTKGPSHSLFSQLTRHIKIGHNPYNLKNTLRKQGTKHECPSCPSTFDAGAGAEFTLHILEGHHPPPPAICRYCWEAFSSFKDGELLSHEQSHMTDEDKKLNEVRLRNTVRRRFYKENPTVKVKTLERISMKESEFEASYLSDSSSSSDSDSSSMEEEPEVESFSIPV